MQELSIAVGIVDAVRTEAEQRGMGSVSAVYVRLGALSGVDKDALLFAFPMACEDTELQGAELAIEDVPVRIACAACGQESAPESIYELICPCCGAAADNVVSGRELELRAFEACQEVQT